MFLVVSILSIVRCCCTYIVSFILKLSPINPPTRNLGNSFYDSITVKKYLKRIDLYLKSVRDRLKTKKESILGSVSNLVQKEN